FSHPTLHGVHHQNKTSRIHTPMQISTQLYFFNSKNTLNQAHKAFDNSTSQVGWIEQREIHQPNLSTYSMVGFVSLIPPYMG
ncbi:hypothetical protein K8I31_05910, partial [bacterium]|nr:hypothetical protein [bacterium]